MIILRDRGPWLALCLLLSVLAGCDTLPPVTQASAAAPPDPNEFVRLQLAESSCSEQLDILQRDREYLLGYLEAQGVTLEELQASLLRVEKSLLTKLGALTPPPVAACPEIDARLADKQIVGRRENVWVEDFQLALPARIDTGAETASLDASNIEEFERNGDGWVRFDIVHPDSGEPVTLEREVERVARILQSGAEEAERRVVITLNIVIGRVRQQAEFTLSDRSHQNYQALIGRNILRDLMIVDVSKVDIAAVKAADREKKKVSP